MCCLHFLQTTVLTTVRYFPIVWLDLHQRFVYRFTNFVILYNELFIVVFSNKVINSTKLVLLSLITLAPRDYDSSAIAIHRRLRLKTSAANIPH